MRFRRALRWITFDDCDTMEGCVISGNLIKQTTQGILLCNWDIEVNPDHIFKNILVEDNLVIRNNTFAFATGALVQIDEFSKEYSRVFDGNTYIQYASESDMLGARGIGINYFSYNYLTPQSIATFLGNKTGTAKVWE